MNQRRIEYDDKKREWWFQTSLPNICLYCTWWRPIACSLEELFEGVCDKHTIYGLKSKKATAPKIENPNYELDRPYAAVMMADETCEHFNPLSMYGKHFELLKDMGFFDSYFNTNNAKCFKHDCDGWEVVKNKIKEAKDRK